MQVIVGTIKMHQIAIVAGHSGVPLDSLEMKYTISDVDIMD